MSSKWLGLWRRIWLPYLFVQNGLSMFLVPPHLSKCSFIVSLEVNRKMKEVDLSSPYELLIDALWGGGSRIGCHEVSHNLWNPFAPFSDPIFHRSLKFHCSTDVKRSWTSWSQMTRKEVRIMRSGFKSKTMNWNYISFLGDQNFLGCE